MSQRKETWSLGQFQVATRGAKQLNQVTWWTKAEGGLYIKVVARDASRVQVQLTHGACTC